MDGFNYVVHINKEFFGGKSKVQKCTICGINDKNAYLSTCSHCFGCINCTSKFNSIEEVKTKKKISKKQDSRDTSDTFESNQDIIIEEIANISVCCPICGNIALIKPITYF